MSLKSSKIRSNRFCRGQQVRIIHLLGGLLLLLLLGTTVISVFCGCFCGSLFSGCGSLFLLLLTTTGNEESDHILGSNKAIVVDFEFAEDIIDLSFVELITKVHESVAEHLGFDLAIDLVGLEGTDNEVIGIVGATSHLFLEHLDHVVKAASTSNFSQHGVEFGLIHELANIVEGSTKIGLLRVPSLS